MASEDSFSSSQESVDSSDYQGFPLNDWATLKMWDTHIKENLDYSISGLEGRKEGFYWSLDHLDRVFESDFSPLIQQTLIDTIIEYCNSNTPKESLENSILSLGNLKDKARDHFKNVIRRDEFWEKNKQARTTLYGYTAEKSTDSAPIRERRKNLQNLFFEAYGESSHYAYDLKDLEKSLSKSPYITKLRLYSSDYTPDDLIKVGRYINQYLINSLYIDKEVLKSASLGDLAKGMAGNKTLQKISFYNVSFNKKGGFDLFVNALGNLPALKSIHMSSCDLDDKNHDALVKMIDGAINLQDLNLSNNPLADKTVVSLLKSLKNHNFSGSLDLYGFRFGLNSFDTLAFILQENTPLTHLDISVCGLSASQLQVLFEALTPHKNLSYLDISGNTMDGEKAIIALRDFLSSHNTIKTLHLINLQIPEEFLGIIASGLAQNKSLTTLNLSRNKINAISAEALSEALNLNSCLSTLTLSDCGLSDSALSILFTSLSKNKSLETLALSDNIFEKKAAYALKDHLPNHKMLKKLDLSWCKINDETLEILSFGIHENRSLNYILLKGNKIEKTLSLARAIWAAPQVESLSLGENISLSRRNVYALSYIKNKRDFHCHLNGYNQDIMRSLAQERKDRVLRMLEPAQYFKSTQTLNLSYLKLGRFPKNSLDDVAALNLEHIEFFERPFTKLINAIKSTPSLTHLSVRCSYLMDEDTTQFVESIADNKVLTLLDLHNNDVEVKTATSLSEFLKKTTTLKTLDISKTDINRTHTAILSLGLWQNKSLETLNLRDLSLRDLFPLIPALWHHPTLKEVKISYLWLDPQISLEEFKKTLKEKEESPKDLFERATLILLGYISDHKNYGIRTRHQEEISKYGNLYQEVIADFLKSTSLFTIG